MMTWNLALGAKMNVFSCVAVVRNFGHNEWKESKTASVHFSLRDRLRIDKSALVRMPLDHGLPAWLGYQKENNWKK